MLKAYVGVTDWSWFKFLRSSSDVDEVNFWQPSGRTQFRALAVGEPFFLSESDWIPVPPDWAPNIVKGRTYDLGMSPGRELWDQISLLLQKSEKASLESAVAQSEERMYGNPILMTHRLGQGAFRVMVTDFYERRCAVTGEKSLPVLEAAHIRPVADNGMHRIGNGLLIRSDIHRLFDRGYVTVTPDYRFLVSPRLKADFDNGEVYYRMNGG